MFSYITVQRHGVFMIRIIIRILQNHRTAVVERGLWMLPRPATLLRLGYLQPDAQNHVQPGFEHLQDRLNNFSGQPVPLLSSPLSALLPSHRISHFSLCAFPLAPTLPTREESSSVFFPPSHQIFLHIFLWEHWELKQCRNPHHTPQKLHSCHTR